MLITESQLRRIIREAIVSASQEYIEGPEAAMSRTKKFLPELLRLYSFLVLGSKDHKAAINAAMDAAEVSPELRPMILSTLLMIPPEFFISRSS
jgi:hypothetical protein